MTALVILGIVFSVLLFWGVPVSSMPLSVTSEMLS